jgi:predicted amidohydrolase YtcJ
VETPGKYAVKLFRLVPFLLAGCSDMRGPPADLVIRNASIFTAVKTDTASTIIGSIAITGGRLSFVGNDGEAAALIGPNTEVIDGSGRMVLPGFIDSHTHPYSGTELLECDLSEDSTASMILASVRRCAARRTGTAWVRGSNWQLPVFPHANPTAILLDQAVSDRPAYLIAADGHSAWVNSRALALANLTASTRDPENGRIERDAKGEPTGTLREAAMSLVSRLLPP